MFQNLLFIIKVLPNLSHQKHDSVKAITTLEKPTNYFLLTVIFSFQKYFPASLYKYILEKLYLRLIN